MTYKTSSKGMSVNGLTTSKLTRQSSFLRLISCINFRNSSKIFTKVSALLTTGLKVLWRLFARA
jgi:hypothetical protein